MKGWGFYELMRQRAEQLQAEQNNKWQSPQPTYAPGSMEWNAEQEKLRAEREK